MPLAPALRNLIFSLTPLLLAAQQSSPELWYLHHTELDSDAVLTATEATMSRAAEQGYTGVVIWCGGLDWIGRPESSLDTEDRLHTALTYAASKHLKTAVTAAPFGYSVNPLRVNPNWAESSRIVGALFKVDASGSELNFMNSFPGLANSGFESQQSAWFDTHDSGIDIDAQVAHTGNASGVIHSARGNARFRQKLTLTPWRQYHLRLFYRTQDFHGFSQVEVLDSSEVVRFNAQIRAAGSQDWTQLDYVFNSRDTKDAYLYFGVWGGSSGTLWFDDIQLKETALIYVERRGGTPLKVYDPKNPATIYQERADYSYIEDPHIHDQHPFESPYHEPPAVNVPRKTRLTPNQIVAMDFYAVFPIPGTHQVALCLTDEGAADWLKHSIRGIKHLLSPGAGVLLEYDEIRQMNSCGSCRAKHMTAGQLLAWHVGQTVQMFQSVMPEAPLYIWSDMFDPNQNAVNNYYYVEGDLADSWKGLPATVTVMNWNLDKLAGSLRWFAGLDSSQPVAHPQIIAGYYDNGNGGEAAARELRAASGIPGIKGLMYTTWNEDFSQMAAFASAAKRDWPAYRASVSGH